MKSIQNFKITCPYHLALPAHTPAPVRNKGWFYRASDGRRLQRYFCRECQRSFSEATMTLEYRQRKRRVNEFLFTLLASNNSMRRSAVICGVTRKTVARRLSYFSKVAERYQEDLFSDLPAVNKLHFDDMETLEHTKMKPLSIPIAVEQASRLILSVDVARMPAKGLLAEKSLRKYGPRPDERAAGWESVLGTVARLASPEVVITTDSHKRYPKAIRRHLPQAIHIQVKGRRGCVAGQGELKVGGWDPLFSLNHTAAMLRANICRLIRRTWCTTKKKECLGQHIMLYVMWHNETIIAKRQGRARVFPFPKAV